MRLFVCGDVMTGRGIDQVLPHPGDPRLYEPYMADARDYVALAEAVHGPIPRRVEYDYIWGDALQELDRAGVDLRIVNLETSITTSNEYWPDKQVHYRMSPRNIDCLTAARIDCCTLANNHVLDWGCKGLTETLATLDRAEIRHAGAGGDAAQARAPAVLEVPGRGRVLVFSFGSTTSGIPHEWAATDSRPGVNLLPDLSERTCRTVARMMQDVKGPGDLAVASIHWGGNWGYEIPQAQVRFAHGLIEQGFDLVHGHSSHHVKALEVYRNRPILYGCGDLLTDYEGIGGFEPFRGDLALMYIVTLAPDPARPAELRMIPVQMKHFRLNRASSADAQWIQQLLNREGTRFGTQVVLHDDNSLTVG